MASNGRSVLGVEAGPTSKALNQVAILFPNHGENMLERMSIGEDLRRLGFHVYLAAYPEKRSSQSPEAHERESLEQMRVQLDYLNKRYSGYPVTLIGETIGASLAAKALVTYGLQLHHFVLVSPWLSLGEVASQRPSIYPMKQFISQSYELLPFLKAYQGHVSLIATGSERSIPETHVDAINSNIFGGRHEAIWWAEEASASDWLKHFTPKQQQAMLVHFNHLVPLEGSVDASEQKFTIEESTATGTPIPESEIEERRLPPNNTPNSVHVY